MTETAAPLNLTYGKLRNQINAIVEKAIPLPRGENCLPVGEMERALVNHVYELLLAVATENAGLRRDLAANEDGEDARLAVAQRALQEIKGMVGQFDTPRDAGRVRAFVGDVGQVAARGLGEATRG